MSHWHRPPKTVSVRGLVQRSMKCILVDRAIEVSSSVLKGLSDEVLNVRDIDPFGKLQLANLVRLCQEMQALLITSNEDVLPALLAESKAPWGAILLSADRTSRADELKRLAANQLNVRPAGDLDSMAAFCQQNRLLVDMRQPRPTIGVYFVSNWVRAKS